MRSRNMAVIGAVFLAYGAVPAQAADVASLGWMSGQWVSEGTDGWTEELWTVPRGGMLLGTNRSGRGDKPMGFEFLRISSDAEGSITYWASPGGKTPTAFALASQSESEAVFENPANDFPTRIVYRRDGETLVATISGADGGNSLSWTFRRPASR